MRQRVVSTTAYVAGKVMPTCGKDVRHAGNARVDDACAVNGAATKGCAVVRCLSEAPLGLGE